MLAGPARGTAATVNVSVGNIFFSPATVTISAGDTVVWTWVSGVHNVTFPTNNIASANLSPGSSFTNTFNTAGTFAYVCTLHLPTQTGTIIVTNPPANVPPTVTINQPTNGMKLLAGSLAVITTTANDPDGAVQRVEFYERGTNFIGVVSNAPFNLTATNIMPGNFALSARVFDNLGASNDSATVNIQVLTNSTLLVDSTLTNQPAFYVSNAIAGQTYVFEALTNLSSGAFGSRWFPIATNVASSTNFIFNDSVLTNFFPRLYRVRQDL